MWSEIVLSIVGTGVLGISTYQLGRWSERKRLNISMDSMKKNKELFNAKEYEEMLKKHLELLEELK